MAFNPAVLFVLRNVAVSAQRKMRAVMQPQLPINRKVRRPHLSTKKAVHMLPMMVKVVLSNETLSMLP